MKDQVQAAEHTTSTTTTADGFIAASADVCLADLRDGKICVCTTKALNEPRDLRFIRDLHYKDGQKTHLPGDVLRNMV